MKIEILGTCFANPRRLLFQTTKQIADDLFQSSPRDGHCSQNQQSLRYSPTCMQLLLPPASVELRVRTHVFLVRWIPLFSPLGSIFVIRLILCCVKHELDEHIWGSIKIIRILL